MDVTQFLSQFAQSGLIKTLNIPVADNYFVFLVLPLVLLAFASYFYFVKQEKKVVIALILSVLIAGAASIALKSVYHEARPCFGLLACDLDFGFPSSHASVTFAITFALIGTIAFIPGLTFAIYASLMRVFTNLHSFPQIVAGAALGVISAMLVRQFIFKIQTHSHKSASSELKRQLIHAACGVAAIMLFYALPYEYALLTLSVVLIAGLIAFNYTHSKSGTAFHKLAASFERKGALLGQGALTLLLGVVFAFTFARPIESAFAVVAILTVADSAATIAGQRFGRHKLPFNENKSIEGAVTFALVSIVVAQLFVAPQKAIIYALVLTFVEMFSIGIDDNLSIPIVGSLLTLIV